MWELLTPSTFSNSDFETLSKRMGGFCHNTTSFTISNSNLHQDKLREFQSWISHQIRSKLNVSLIQLGSMNNNSTGNTRELEWRFAGSLQKEMREDRVLIGISCQS